MAPEVDEDLVNVTSVTLAGGRRLAATAGAETGRVDRLRRNYGVYSYVFILYLYIYI